MPKGAEGRPEPSCCGFNGQRWVVSPCRWSLLGRGGCAVLCCAVSCCAVLCVVPCCCFWRGMGALGSGTPAMHLSPACGHLATELLQCTATLPGGSGRWKTCNAPPHRLGAEGSRTPTMHRYTRAVSSETRAMHRHTASGQWAVDLLQCTAPLHAGSGECNSCNAVPHCLVAAGGSPAMHRPTTYGQWPWNSCNAPPHCLRAVGCGNPEMHCHTASGQGAVELPQCTAILPTGNGQWNSCNAPVHCLRVVGIGNLEMHRPTACGLWAVVLLQCTTTLPGVQCGVELLQCTATLLGGSGHWKS